MRDLARDLAPGRHDFDALDHERRDESSLERGTRRRFAGVDPPLQPDRKGGAGGDRKLLYCGRAFLSGSLDFSLGFGLAPFLLRLRPLTGGKDNGERVEHDELRHVRSHTMCLRAILEA